MALWSTPAPLQGVKSRKRRLFEVTSLDVCTSSGAALQARGLALTLSSRVAAAGTAGCCARKLLLGQQEAPAEQFARHRDLRVLHLAPEQLRSQLAPGTSYVEAVAAAVAAERPHVLLLDDAPEAGDGPWADAFEELLGCEALRRFQGALVVCAAAETRSMREVCVERWVATDGQLRQELLLEVIEGALDAGERAEACLAEALEIDYCNLRYWVDKAHKGDWDVTAFAGGPDRSLRGIIFHHMIESRAEFHVRFIFVPKEHRGSGIGAQLVRWAIGRAARIPEADCRWISLSAADDTLVPWYEKFGFFDMSCGHVAGDDGQTWMEMKNVPLAADVE